MNFRFAKISGVFIPIFLAVIFSSISLEIFSRFLLHSKNIEWTSKGISSNAKPSTTYVSSHLYHHISLKSLNTLQNILSSKSDYILLLGDSQIQQAFGNHDSLVINNLPVFTLAEPGWSPLIYNAILSHLDIASTPRLVYIYLDETDPGDDFCRYSKLLNKNHSSSSDYQIIAVNGSNPLSVNTIFDPILSSYVQSNSENFALIKLLKLIFYRLSKSLLLSPYDTQCSISEVFAWRNTNIDTAVSHPSIINFVDNLNNLRKISSFRLNSKLVLGASSETLPKTRPSLSSISSLLISGSYFIPLQPLRFNKYYPDTDKWGHLHHNDQVNLRNAILETISTHISALEN